jgi:hypothetical protein
MADEAKPFPDYIPAPSDRAHAAVRGKDLHEQSFDHLEPTDSQRVATAIVDEEAKRAFEKRKAENDGEKPQSVGDVVNPENDPEAPDSGITAGDKSEDESENGSATGSDEGPERDEDDPSQPAEVGDATSDDEREARVDR